MQAETRCIIPSRSRADSIQQRATTVSRICSAVSLRAVRAVSSKAAGGVPLPGECGLERPGPQGRKPGLWDQYPSEEAWCWRAAPRRCLKMGSQRLQRPLLFYDGDVVEMPVVIAKTERPPQKAALKRTGKFVQTGIPQPPRPKKKPPAFLSLEASPALPSRRHSEKIAQQTVNRDQDWPGPRKNFHSTQPVRQP